MIGSNDEFAKCPEEPKALESQAVSSSAEATPRPKRPYRRRLASFKNVRSALADLAHRLEGQLEKGEKDPALSSVSGQLTNVYNTMLSALEKGSKHEELEERLARLEEAALGRQHSGARRAG